MDNDIAIHNCKNIISSNLSLNLISYSNLLYLIYQIVLYYLMGKENIKYKLPKMIKLHLELKELPGETFGSLTWLLQNASMALRAFLHILRHSLSFFMAAQCQLPPYQPSIASALPFSSSSLTWEWSSTNSKDWQ